MEHKNFSEYFKILQLEYLTFEFRSNNYTEDKDLKFIIRVLERKKARIEDIANVNNYLSIFTSQEVRVELENELGLNSGMFPTLYYKSEEDFARFCNLDLFYFLKKDERVQLDDQTVGTIETIELQLATGFVYVRIDESTVLKRNFDSVEKV